MHRCQYESAYISQYGWLLAGGEDHQAAKQEELTLLARLHLNVNALLCFAEN